MLDKAIAIVDVFVILLAFVMGLAGNTGLAIAGVALYLSTPATISLVEAFKDESISK